MLEYWKHTPPAHLQLARIAAYLGIKPPGSPVKSAHDVQQQDAAWAEMLGSMPVNEAPEIMTPDEYLKRRATNA